MNGDEVLAKLEKYTKQYDLYAFLLEESHRTVFLKEINDMGFSHSSLDSLIKKVILKNIPPRFSEILMQIVYLNKNKKRILTKEQQDAFEAIQHYIHDEKERTFYYTESQVQVKPKSIFKQ